MGGNYRKKNTKITVRILINSSSALSTCASPSSSGKGESVILSCLPIGLLLNLTKATVLSQNPATILSQNQLNPSPCPIEFLTQHHAQSEPKTFIFLKPLDHSLGNLPDDGNEGHTVKQSVGKTADEIGGTRAGGCDAYTRKSRGPSIALGGEDATLLMTWKEVTDDVGAREGLVDLHGRTAGVGKDIGDALPVKSFYEDFGAFSRFVESKSGNKKFRGAGGGGCGGGDGGNGNRGWFGGGIRIREGTRDPEGMGMNGFVGKM